MKTHNNVETYILGSVEFAALVSAGKVQVGAKYIIEDASNVVYIGTGSQTYVSTIGNTATPANVTIELAASSTTDGMDITLTVVDAAGTAIAGVFELEWWISEAATGIGLTADTYSGDVTTGTGTEWEEIVSKKHYVGLTNASGVLVATAVASANPADQYVAVKHPVTGRILVSSASGTNWEGAA